MAKLTQREAERFAEAGFSSGMDVCCEGKNGRSYYYDRLFLFAAGAEGACGAFSPRRGRENAGGSAAVNGTSSRRPENVTAYPVPVSHAAGSRKM